MKTLAFVVMVGASVMCWGKNKPDGQDLRQQLQTAEGRCIRWAERIEKDAGGLGVVVPASVVEARKGLEEYRKAPEWIGLRSRTSKTAAAAAGKLGRRLEGVEDLLELAEDEIEQEARRRRLEAAAADPEGEARRAAAVAFGNAEIEAEQARRAARASAVLAEEADYRAAEAEDRAKKAEREAAAARNAAEESASLAEEKEAVRRWRESLKR